MKAIAKIWYFNSYLKNSVSDPNGGILEMNIRIYPEL